MHNIINTIFCVPTHIESPDTCTHVYTNMHSTCILTSCICKCKMHGDIRMHTCTHASTKTHLIISLMKKDNLSHVIQIQVILFHTMIPNIMFVLPFTINIGNIFINIFCKIYFRKTSCSVQKKQIKFLILIT